MKLHEAVDRTAIKFLRDGGLSLPFAIIDGNAGLMLPAILIMSYRVGRDVLPAFSEWLNDRDTYAE